MTDSEKLACQCKRLNEVDEALSLLAILVESIISKSKSYIAITNEYVVLVTDYIINCTSGTFEVTLPTAVGITGQQFIIKNSGNGAITIATTSSQTIDGNASGSIVLSQYESLSVISNGANWIIV